MKYILGSDSITVFVDGKPVSVNRSAKTFNMLLDAVKKNDMQAVRSAINLKETIVNNINAKSKKVRLANGEIFYEDTMITGLVASRIFEMLRLGLSVEPMVLFLENLMQNPSKRAVDELFGFMEACSLPITEDGHFLAYKRVRGDYKDCYSGTMDNSVGKVLSMPRNAVDEDKNRTCSAGLHFCSYSYLKHFNGERVVIVKINPADVVAIPADYNNAKGRTCRYEVVGEIPLETNSSYAAPQYELDEGFTKEYSLDSPIGKTSLDVATVRAIKDDLEDGMTIASIARKFNTSTRTVARIRDGEIEAYRNI